MLIGEAARILTTEHAYSDKAAWTVLQNAETAGVHCDGTIHITVDFYSSAVSYDVGPCTCGITCPDCGEGDNITETRLTASADSEHYVLECGECGSIWRIEIIDPKAGQGGSGYTVPPMVEEFLPLGEIIARRSGIGTPRKYAESMLASYLKQRGRDDRG